VAINKYENYIRATCLLGLETFEQANCTSLKDLMIETGLDPNAMKRPDALISYNAVCTLLERASKEWDRPFLGMEFAIRTDRSFPTLGGLLLLAKFNNTLRDWLSDALEYWAMHTNGFNVELRENIKTGVSALVILNNSFVLPTRQMVQTGIGNICRITRILTNREDEAPIEIHFSHARQKGEGFEELAKILYNCPIYFESEENQIIFPTEYLEYKIDNSFSLFKRFLRIYIQKRIDLIGNYESTASFMVVHAIPNFFGTNFCNFNSVADFMDIKPKTLQRMLAAENTNFKELLSFVRMEKAKEMLSTSDVSIGLLAGFLGYSDAAPFSFAFRRATGFSPLEYRKRFTFE
jgi:AraC-like DNA-binding protein